MARGAGIWSFMARRYSRQPVFDEESYKRKLEMTRAYLTPQSQVLEIGCGTGSTALLHAPHVAHILALDYARQMIEIAKEKAEADGIENVTFEQGIIEEMEFPPRSFDVVLALNILHLVPDIPGTLRRVHGLLKPGGVLIASTMCFKDDLKTAARVMGFLGSLRVLPSIVAVGEAELAGMMEDAGFEMLETWKPGPRKAVFTVARKST